MGRLGANRSRTYPWMYMLESRRNWPNTRPTVTAASRLVKCNEGIYNYVHIYWRDTSHIQISKFTIADVPILKSHEKKYELCRAPPNKKTCPIRGFSSISPPLHDAMSLPSQQADLLGMFRIITVKTSSWRDTHRNKKGAGIRRKYVSPKL